MAVRKEKPSRRVVLLEDVESGKAGEIVSVPHATADKLIRDEKARALTLADLRAA